MFFLLRHVRVPREEVNDAPHDPRGGRLPRVDAGAQDGHGLVLVVVLKRIKQNSSCRNLEFFSETYVRAGRGDGELVDVVPRQRPAQQPLLADRGAELVLLDGLEVLLEVAAKDSQTH